MVNSMTSLRLLDSISDLPKASIADTESLHQTQEFRHKVSRLNNADMQGTAEAILAHPHGRQLLGVLFSHSPYLTSLVLQQPEFFCRLCLDIEPARATIENWLQASPASFASRDTLMAHLRRIKNHAALLAAVADIAGAWELEEVTGFLSHIAGATLRLTVDFLLLDAKKRGEMPSLNAENPSTDSGWIVLAMGKLGAGELNYSSDIDLIVLYDPDRIQYAGKQTAQECFNRMTRDLVGIMQERTPQGYVFRTDIRLRPDPSSTPPALSTYAAMTYYETVGQNWERAAMIKALPIAGDIVAGDAFVKALTPFVWRRNLDFAAIRDILSIKRQMDHRIGSGLAVAGHNVKLGSGGIREIEFFVQTQQLIWGGRNPHLRLKPTCKMLDALADAEIIDRETAEDLQKTYRYLRMLEHRVQMQQDQQKHSLPTESEALAGFALFCGFDSFEAFESATLAHLQSVKGHYNDLYGAEEPLGKEGNLVFTGVDIDPGTVETLTRMGFTQARTMCEIIMNWHRGHRRATRNKRAREILTEIVPDLLQALANTVHPDTAFIKFDEFINKLPAGVQIFSLFAANPELLRLIALIMGSAPRLAEILSRRPHLLDTVLTGRFYEALPGKNVLKQELETILATRQPAEDVLDLLCRYHNEKSFQAGIQLMNKVAGWQETGQFLSDLAEVLLVHLRGWVEEEFAPTYGHVSGSELVIIAMGKLGARELTFASDLDLIFLYDMPDADSRSDGTKPLAASTYFDRLCQRFVGAITALGREGRLYEVDTRLRPLGSDGPLAASFAAYDQYFNELAWTFERMALTRARVIDAPAPLRSKLEATILKHLTQPTAVDQLRADAAQMRQRIEQEFGSKNHWNIKYYRGGMMDIDFIAQYLQLRHGATHPDIFGASTQQVLIRLKLAGLLPGEDAETLIEASGLYAHLLHLLRLCSDGSLKEEDTPQGLKTLLCDQLDFASFEELKNTLHETEESVYRIYQSIFHS